MYSHSALLSGWSSAAVKIQPAQLVMLRMASGPVASAWAQRAGVFSELAAFFSNPTITTSGQVGPKPAGGGKFRQDEEREKLSDLHKLLGLRHTFFLGNQKQDELRRLYNAADVFVMPSRREPFGLVALEAMACGLPVVGSNEGGLPEFINSSVGTLVSSNDEDAFCGAILEELAHSREAPERRAFIARYARENFAQELFVAKLEDVYASVLS